MRVEKIGARTNGGLKGLFLSQKSEFQCGLINPQGLMGFNEILSEMLEDSEKVMRICGDINGKGMFLH